METLQRIGPWLTLGVAAAVVLFFCGFYIRKLYHVYRMKTLSAEKPEISSNTIDSRQKIKNEILTDLEKKLEAL